MKKQRAADEARWSSQGYKDGTIPIDMEEQRAIDKARWQAQQRKNGSVPIEDMEEEDKFDLGDTSKDELDNEKW